jgi:hypothetical protein
VSPEAVALELTSPAGEPLRVEWPAGPFAGQESSWRLAGEIDWDEVEALRILSAALPDGRGLALAAVRPAGAAGHGAEVVGAALVASAEVERVDEALLSVQSDGDAMPQRVGLELHTSPGAMPLRIAADVTEASSQPEGELVHVRATLEVRLEGKRSAGLYEVLRAASG